MNQIWRDRWKFQSEVAHLYHFLHDKDNPQYSKVRTPDGRGTLISAFSGAKGCRVLLDREKATNRYKGGKPWKPTRAYSAREIEEA